MDSEWRTNPQGEVIRGVAQILEAKGPQRPTRLANRSKRKRGKGVKKYRLPPIYRLEDPDRESEKKGGEQELLELLCLIMQGHEKNQKENIARARLLIDQFQEKMAEAQRSLGESHDAEQRLRKNSCYSQVVSLLQIALSVGINVASWSVSPGGLWNFLYGVGIILSLVGLAPHLLSTWHAVNDGKPLGWYEKLSDHTKEVLQRGAFVCSIVGSIIQLGLSIGGLWNSGSKEWGDSLNKFVSISGGAIGVFQAFIQADSWRIRAVISEIQAKYEEQERQQITCDHHVKGILEQIKMQRLFGTMKELAELLRQVIDTKDKLLQSEWTKGGGG